MPRKIKLEEPFDLQKTLECGQTFFWHRDGEKYYTIRNGGLLKVWQEDDKLFYENYGNRIDPAEVLRIGDPLEEICEEISKDNFVSQAIQENRGLRIINDEFFHCLISFITSAQMQIPRIKEIQDQLAERHGKNLELEGEIYHQFPEPQRLSKVPLEELKDLGLGYRADYVKRTSEMVAENEIRTENIKKMKYEEAKQELMKLQGVGDKVADCVLLFSLDFLQAFPIDTWMWKVIQEKYPELNGRNYDETSEKMRDYFGRYAGYAHEYLFHYGRTCMDFE
ncbi:MAG: DNA-3-methyladenine glycosylase family protein [Candidatus Aenigmatarchaeota archaeon]